MKIHIYKKLELHQKPNGLYFDPRAHVYWYECKSDNTYRAGFGANRRANSIYEEYYKKQYQITVDDIFLIISKQHTKIIG